MFIKCSTGYYTKIKRDDILTLLLFLVKPDNFPPRAADDCPQDKVKRSNNRAKTEVILQLDVTGTKVHGRLTAGVVRDGAEQVGVKRHS